jgi:hypothetical protein
MRWVGKLDALGISFPWYRWVEESVEAAKVVESTDAMLDSVPEMVSWGSNWREGATEM